MKFFTAYDKFTHNLLFASSAISVISLVSLAIVYNKLPPSVPLLYSRPWGEQQLIPSGFLFGLPVICLLIVFVNSMIMKFYGGEWITKNSTGSAKKEQALLIIRILAVSSLVSIIVGIIGLVRALLLV